MVVTLWEFGRPQTFTLKEDPFQSSFPFWGTHRKNYWDYFFSFSKNIYCRKIRLEVEQYTCIFLKITPILEIRDIIIWHVRFLKTLCRNKNLPTTMKLRGKFLPLLSCWCSDILLKFYFSWDESWILNFLIWVEGEVSSIIRNPMQLFVFCSQCKTFEKVYNYKTIK